MERELQALHAAKSAAGSPAVGRGPHFEVLTQQFGVDAVVLEKSIDGAIAAMSKNESAVPDVCLAPPAVAETFW